jgi:hypothetical protein
METSSFNAPKQFVQDGEVGPIPRAEAGALGVYLGLSDLADASAPARDVASDGGNDPIDELLAFGLSGQSGGGGDSGGGVAGAGGVARAGSVASSGGDSGQVRQSHSVGADKAACKALLLCRRHLEPLLAASR